mmetsp:Transcript_72614/g.216759  ORF Transcript_72614/g.216759 Transcript_72614/m.216759 type:complete len:261 (+) Transcript_72614:768-1550(+)
MPTSRGPTRRSRRWRCSSPGRGEWSRATGTRTCLPAWRRGWSPRSASAASCMGCLPTPPDGGHPGRTRRTWPCRACGSPSPACRPRSTRRSPAHGEFSSSCTSPTLAEGPRSTCSCWSTAGSAPRRRRSPGRPPSRRPRPRRLPTPGTTGAPSTRPPPPSRRTTSAPRPPWTGRSTSRGWSTGRRRRGSSGAPTQRRCRPRSPWTPRTSYWTARARTSWRWPGTSPARCWTASLWSGATWSGSSASATGRSSLCRPPSSW